MNARLLAALALTLTAALMPVLVRAQGEPIAPRFVFPEVRLLEELADDLEFNSVAPRSFDVALIWQSDGGFVARLPDPDGSCLDIVANNAETAAALDRLKSDLTAQVRPSTAHLRITMDAVANIPASRGSYYVLNGELILSSSAWYRQAGRQVFLSCPVPTGAWQVHRVVAVAVL